METERQSRRWQIVVGAVWLCLLGALLLREAVAWLHELQRLRAGGAQLATMLERGSQLKPALWKAPWNGVEWAAYAAVLLLAVGMTWIWSIRRSRHMDRKAQNRA